MKLIVLIIAVLFGANSYGQNSGYFGKKTIIEAEGLGYIRLLGYLLDNRELYKKAGSSSLTSTNNLLNLGWRVNVARIVMPNIGIGIETGYDYQHIGFASYQNNVETANYSNIEFNHEMLNVNTLNIIPKVIFTNSGGLLPLGFSHEVGIGYSNSKVIKKDYAYVFTQNQQYVTDTVRTLIEDNYVDFSRKYNGMTFMYAMKMHYPISKSLLINFGFKYAIHTGSLFSIVPHSTTTVIDNFDVYQTINKMRMYNFMTLNVGMTFML